ncbi:MAG TPA: propanediol/glycerol family dehydratase large subunit, partial [Thermoleophilia bacterium]|nr:propanediol/glycerol family dehydratase large subunit [Thermoleophilia bacterium]
MGERERSRLRRFEALDGRPVNLDGFAQRDDEAGLVAFASANDPEPSIAIELAGGSDEDGWTAGAARVVELDGHAAAEFDLIDAFIAARGIDTAVAEEANELDDV